MVAITQNSHRNPPPSFSRTYPHGSHSNPPEDAQPVHSSWNWPCDDKFMTFSPEPAETHLHQPPTPVVTFDKHNSSDVCSSLHDGSDAVSVGKLKALLQQEISNHRNRLKREVKSQQEAAQKSIQFTSYDEEHVQIYQKQTGFHDAENNECDDPPIKLNTVSLDDASLQEFDAEETFEPDKTENFRSANCQNSAEGKWQSEQGGYNFFNDEYFRHDSESTDDFTASVGLNSYLPIDDKKSHTNPKPSTKKSKHPNIHRGENIFRSRSNEHDPPNEILEAASAPGQSSLWDYNSLRQDAHFTRARTAEKNDQFSSPSQIMNRRRVSCSPQPARPTRARRPSQNTNQSAQATSSPYRTPNKQSDLANIAPPKSGQRSASPSTAFSRDESRSRSRLTITSQSRTRSTSRSHRSRSRSTRRRRSRSRSTSVTPGHSRHRSSDPGEDEYNAALFRGAALIRNQLLRSMASADQAMDDAEREFMEQMAERRCRRGEDVIRKTNSGTSRANSSGFDVSIFETSNNQEADSDEVDFDYSQGLGAASFLPPSSGSDMNYPANNDGQARSTATFYSQSSSDLETESRRLDKLAKIFAAASSVSTAPPMSDVLQIRGAEVNKKSHSSVEGESPGRSFDDVIAEANSSHGIFNNDSLAAKTVGNGRNDDPNSKSIDNTRSKTCLRVDIPTSPAEEKAGESRGDGVSLLTSSTSYHPPLNSIQGSDCFSSPMSSLGVGSSYSQLGSSLESLSRRREPNTQIRNEYTRQYFKEETHKTYTPTTPKTMPTDSLSSAANDLNFSPTLDSKHVRQEPRQQQQKPLSPPRASEQEDEALNHARSAGPFWRSLVGNHVRFPRQWESLLPPTSPTLHRPNRKWSKWYYVARHRVKGDTRLNSREFGVKSRRSGGRILMRMAVREMHTKEFCREVAIGCLHPNAKGIRNGEPLPEIEDVREVWMAVRWVMKDDESEPVLDLREEKYDYEGVVDRFLLQNRRLDYRTMGSALGHRKAVTNENVRAVFGDKPPINSVDFHEDELAEILQANRVKKLAVCPALLLLKLFLLSNQFP